MSFIDFESATAKEKARQELREARAELLTQAEKRFNHRQELDAQRKLRGEDEWMLPAVARKLEKSAASGAAPKKSKKPKKEKKSKKSKKEKKTKSKSKKRKKYVSSDSDDSSSSSDEGEDRRRKTSKQKKRSSTSNSSNSSSGSESDEWVESHKDKNPAKPAADKKMDTPGTVQRDDWMSGILIPTFTKPVAEKKKDDRKTLDSYDSAKSSRELNPFWKNGGGGLPSASATSSSGASFKKPKNDSDSDDDDYRDDRRARSSQQSTSRQSTSSASRGNWRKTKPPADSNERPSTARDRRSPSPDRSRRDRHVSPGISNPSRSPSPTPSLPETLDTPAAEVEPAPKPRTQDFLTDQQMNDLGAKLLKAEIMGNTEQAESLRSKLAAARAHRETHKKNLVAAARAKATSSGTGTERGVKTEQDEVLLTATNSRGYSKPLQRHAATAPADPWGGRSGGGGKKKQPKKVDTHTAGERVRYFADDDKYDIKQMFENEKFSSGHDQDAQFADIVGRHKNPNDDLDDLFAERVRQGPSDEQLDSKDRARAIRQHQEIAKTLDTCDKCFDSPKMQKQLIVSMGTNVYLALPWFEGLLQGHCQIVPVQHVPCATQLDEDVWAEVVEFQKALTKMFRSRGQDVIFFETARYLHRRPHMVIQCVPHKDFELAPFYFKKAIQESEREWSTNKQLVTLREKDLRRSIPKGLPYFWVHFGIDSGFAHVIEEQDRFPENFATEIIGGMLELDARKWRRQRKEQNSIARVTQVAEWWKPFDITGE